MPVTVGFPPRRARPPSAWREALPGMVVVSGPERDELVERLLDGRLDALVLPEGELAEDGALTPGGGLAVGATPVRAEARDLLLPAEGQPTLQSLPAGARVALSGARRQALLAIHRPDLEAVELPGEAHGTVGPFLRGGGADAAVLPAHLARVALLSDRASQLLEPKSWMPGPGQGASVVVVRADDGAARRGVAPLHHPPTRAALEAERAVGRELGLGPDSALGVLSLPYGRWLRLWAMLPAPGGLRLVRGDLSGSDRAPAELGRAMAGLLRERGAHLLTGAVS